ncbi:MAG: hypothetical protein DWQ07_06870 [Chloroflexi bacterium]|nr:MAG: hypothetical protein DWQ07_06870 [Chloroflexota bacterium]MBL1195577.1 hypothetical protein [Chloroflexota bacterium]NOH12862.1 hypothetical protein [Chloroflexota bacterium]
MEEFWTLFGAGTAVTVLVGLCITVLSLVFTFGIIFFVFRMVRNRNQNIMNLRATGLDGTAEILALQDTGMLVNNNPRVQLKMMVTPQDGEAYEVDTAMIVSMLQIPQVQPGNVVAVKIDPNDPNKVVFA